jgi:tRNA (cmo5U34)-methyltransferase
MEIDKISGSFDKVAEIYDKQRRFFIPCFDDYYGTTVSFLAKAKKNFKSILDLGAGTGLVTKYLFDQFPDADYTLFDASDKMVEVARERFSGMKNFKFIISDYSKELPIAGFDLIASALSIHHLENDAKLKLYKAIYNKLPDNGYFLNLDQFNANTVMMNDLYNQWWYDFIKKSKITEKEMESWLVRRELDRENTIDETKDMLMQAGFKIIECIYSYMKFGVILAIK